MGAFPHVVDINGDGKKDLISGDSRGQVWFFFNKGTAESPELDAGEKVKAAGKVITDDPKAGMGRYSKLTYGDWDGDGLPDLLIGHDGRERLVWYRNVGKKNAPEFAAPKPMELPSFTTARPSPLLADLDKDGKIDLVLGSEHSKIFFARNKGTLKEHDWETPVELNLKIQGEGMGYRCRPCVADWNNDGKPDLLVGDRSRKGGNVWLFLGQ